MSVRNVVNRFLRKGGYELSRLKPSERAEKHFDDPDEALQYEAGQALPWVVFSEAWFDCPLEEAVVFNGFGFSRKAWHPFTEALEEYAADDGMTYRESVLKRYYDAWQPRTASEALLGREKELLREEFAPACAEYLLPWLSLDAATVARLSRKGTDLENAEHGREGLALKTGGCKWFGPVSAEKGELEYRRLVRVYRSIRKRSFDRSRGYAGVVRIGHDGALRYLVIVGHHRAAAMKALGETTIPAKFLSIGCVDSARAHLLPMVRAGIWKESSIRDYFNHLFSGDSLAWARSREADLVSRPVAPG